MKGIYPEPKNVSSQLKDLISKILTIDVKRIKI